MNSRMDYLFARLNIDGKAPYIGSSFVGIIITCIIYFPLIEFPIFAPSSYKISILTLLAWATSFSVVTLLVYCAILIKDFGGWIFTIPLGALFGALRWVRSDLEDGSVTLEKSFHSVEFIARNLSEKVFLTDTYFFVQSLIVLLIFLLVINQYSDDIKEWLGK